MSSRGPNEQEMVSLTPDEVREMHPQEQSARAWDSPYHYIPEPDGVRDPGGEWRMPEPHEWGWRPRAQGPEVGS